MRVGVRRLVLYSATACLLIFLVVRLGGLGRDPKVLDSDCRVPEETRRNLAALLADTDRVLGQLGVRRFLCYGTLWGVLKAGGLLPWEDNAELCAFNEQLSGFEEATLIRTFRKNGLRLAYDSREGTYEVTARDRGGGGGGGGGTQGGLLRIVVFEKDPDLDMMKRVGWSRRLLPPDCDISPSLHCFPPRLVEEPLPVAALDGVEYRVPREDIEMQKYLYPDSWWKDVKPKQC